MRGYNRRMRYALSAFVGLILALIHAWGGPSCGCEMGGSGEQPGAMAAMDCCCDHGAPANGSCEGDCDELHAAAPAPTPSALPQGLTGLIIPAPPLRLERPALATEHDSPAHAARGPPEDPPLLWLRHRSIRC